MSEPRDADEARARAERLLRRAEVLCRKAAAVLCTPAVRRAERRALRACDLVHEAVDLAAAPAFAALGLPPDHHGLRPVTFVDQASWQTLRRIDYGLIAARHGLAETEELAVPRRCDFEERLVHDPRETVDDLARIARLAPDSLELRNLRASLSRPAEVPGRRVRRQPKT
jgi:hypothetical protein